MRTVSKFGLVRDREYRSSREVAEGIVSCFEYCNETTLELIADVRISGKSGCIMITTKSHMVAHNQSNRYVMIISNLLSRACSLSIYSLGTSVKIGFRAAYVVNFAKVPGVCAIIKYWSIIFSISMHRRQL